MYSNFVYESKRSCPSSAKPGLTLAGVPRRAAPTTPFGRRLVQLRTERSLTQTQLADLIGSTQRNISHYETVAELPPAHVLVKIAKALGVTADELLDLKTARSASKTKDDPETRRLWRKFQLVRTLPDKDQRAVIRLINSLVAARKAS